MGLDLYVGPLTRYYAGNWETIVQQRSKQLGVPVEIVRPRQGLFWRLFDRLSPRPPTAETAVRRWRDALRRDLRIADLDWNEDREVDYETDKPAWDCYGALVLWAAYNEAPSAKRLETAKGWETDAAYLASAANKHSRYRHMIANTEIWLPIDFEAPTETAAIVGDRVVVGSSVRLLAELRDLNSRTWNANNTQILQWRHDGAEYGAPLETSARFGFSIFHGLTNLAVSRRLPMKLDY